jgi:acetylornithine deacetylase/succinyl-diaminopimelate desuccinylase-like protein
MSEWFEELSELLRIPSISAEPEHAADVMRAAEWTRDFIRTIGGEADVVDWHGQPLVVGEVRASKDAETAPTVIAYGHYDVQPPDPLELWTTDPFQPVLRDDRLYARGIADDKGSVYMLLAGTRRLAQAGELPVNVRFTFEGEEETGGDSILQLIEADERGGDAAIVLDGGWLSADVPTFNSVTRGMIYCHVSLRTGKGDLHSGEYGGVALNAAHALIRTLDALIARDGRLVEPLRAGIVPPTAAELAGWAKLPSGAAELAEQGARPADPQAAEEFYIRTGAEPSLDVNGIQSGSPFAQKTVLPVRADANLSVRLVPGQDAQAIAATLERLLREAAPAGATLEIEISSASDAAVVDADAQAISLAQDAFERVLGTRPILARSGGSVPIVGTFSRRGIPAIVTGFFLPDSNIHAPNENLLAKFVPLGIDAVAAMLQAFGELTPAH